MSKSIEEVVREKYGAVAASTLSSEHAGVRKRRPSVRLLGRRAREHPGRIEHGSLLREPNRDGESTTW